MSGASTAWTTVRAEEADMPPMSDAIGATKPDLVDLPRGQNSNTTRSAMRVG
jgi:hypothetical protein